MKRTLQGLMIVGLGCVGSLSALANDVALVPVVPLPQVCTFSQPYTPPAAAFRSRVSSCTNPAPMDRIAFDDFFCEQGGLAGQLRWWGTLSNAQQIGRPYYIAIYSDQNCHPNVLLYQACVIPQVQQVSMNCNNNAVFRFQSAIPAFNMAAGVRYWLQISEDDANSYTQGQDDFRWAGRQPVNGCPALQLDAGGEFHTLIDPCNQQLDDLSFQVKVQVQVAPGE